MTKCETLPGPLCDIIKSTSAWPIPRGISHNRDIITRHAEACASRSKFYVDPTGKGQRVIPSWVHLDRGRCCGCKCRHCPFGHAQVAPSLRDARIAAPVILRSLPLPPLSLRHPGIPYREIVLINPCTTTAVAARNAIATAVSMSLPPPLFITVFYSESYRCVWSSWPLSAVIDVFAILGADLLTIPVHDLGSSSSTDTECLTSAISDAILDGLVGHGLGLASQSFRALCNCSTPNTMSGNLDTTYSPSGNLSGGATDLTNTAVCVGYASNLCPIGVLRATQERLHLKMQVPSQDAFLAA